MKKNFLYLVLLLYASVSFGQELHEKLKVKIIEYGISDDGDASIVQYGQYINFTQPMKMGYTGTFFGGGSDESTSTTWYLKDKDKDGFPDGIGFSQEQTYLDTHSTSQHEFIDFTMTGFKDFDKSLFCNGFLNFSQGGVDAETYYKLQLEPILTIIQPTENDIACDDVLITVTDDSRGFHNNSYVWQYRLVDSNWTSFPNSYQGTSTLTVNSSFFNNYLGNVFIKITNCSQETDTVTYNVISCSPKIKEVIPKPTTCEYNDDGSFELKLERDLYPTEKLVVTVFGWNIATNVFDVIPANGQNFNITTLIANSDGTFSYKWPLNLPADLYQIKYQTVNENINIDENYFNSLNFSGGFEIKKPAEVDFSITEASDKTCFETNDGYIDVSASGEDGRTFLYQLKKEGKEQIYNGTIWVDYSGSDTEANTWFAFTNAQTTRISKLNKGTYQVKVKDSQGCFARLD